MSDQDKTTQNRPPATHTPDGKFAPGNLANPGGRPRKLRELEAAVLAAETPAKVKKVVRAMRQMALSGDPKAAPAAAKVYFHVLGLNGKVPEDFANLLDGAPPEVLTWLASRIN